MTQQPETYASRRRTERMAEQKHIEPNENGEKPNLLASVLIGIALFFVVIVLVVVGWKAFYLARIYPGVSVAGVDVSGLSRKGAIGALQDRVRYPSLGTITLVAGEERWQKSPAQMGLVFQVEESVEKAYMYGREGNILVQLLDMLNSAQSGVNIPPIITIDENLANRELNLINEYILSAPVEAELRLDGMNVIYNPGKTGTMIDIEPTKAFLAASMQLFQDGETPVVLKEVQPKVLNAEETAQKARDVLSRPFTIAIPNAQLNDPGPWSMPPEQLASMLRFVRKEVDGNYTYVMAVDADSIKSILTPMVAQVDHPERDGRFGFDEATGELILLEEAKIGYQLNINESIASINATLENGQSDAPLNVLVTKPQVSNDVTAEQLGITQLIESQTTYFWGSSTERRQNIRTAAANFDGILIPPDSVFSMGKYMSDITLENGYAEALIIYNGQTIQGVGGGVCQVSTTLFRTAFYAGLPINERHAHAYRVYYYEQGPGGAANSMLSGFDATVYFPLVDLKFTNNTPYWILMRTFYDDATSSLTWNFYSTPDGRKVTANFSGPKDVVPPLEPLIKFNEELESGLVRRIDYPSEGATVVIDRTVTLASGEQFIDTFKTVYQPWAEACEYGPDVTNVEKVLKNRGWCQPVEKQNSE